MRTARPCTSIALLVVLHYHALATHLRIDQRKAPLL